MKLDFKKYTPKSYISEVVISYLWSFLVLQTPDSRPFLIILTSSHQVYLNLIPHQHVLCKNIYWIPNYMENNIYLGWVHLKTIEVKYKKSSETEVYLQMSSSPTHMITTV